VKLHPVDLILLATLLSGAFYGLIRSGIDWCQTSDMDKRRECRARSPPRSERIRPPGKQNTRG
jgi:hypothetical protein